MALADLAIIAVIALQAWTGRRIGFVMGVFNLIALVAGVIAALVLEEPVAAAIGDAMTLDPGTQRLVTFAVITTGASYLLGFIGGRILGPLMARQQRSRASTSLDRALGLIPAALRGVIYAGSLVFMARLALPAGHDIRMQLDGSSLAGPLQTIFEIFTPYARML